MTFDSDPKTSREIQKKYLADVRWRSRDRSAQRATRRVRRGGTRVTLAADLSLNLGLSENLGFLRIEFVLGDRAAVEQLL